MVRLSALASNLKYCKKQLLHRTQITHHTGLWSFSSTLSDTCEYDKLSFVNFTVSARPEFSHAELCEV